MKSGNFNFLEPSGPLQACKGTVFFCTVQLIFAVIRLSNFRIFIYIQKKIGGVWKLFHLVVRRRKGVRAFDADEFRGVD